MKEIQVAEALGAGSAEPQESVTKIVLYVRNSKLPDEVKNIIRDPIEKGEYGRILEELLKIQIEHGTSSKTIYIPPVKEPKRIKIRRNDLKWLDKTKGDRSRSGWLHQVIKEYKESVEVRS